jgi:cysteine desulfurase
MKPIYLDHNATTPLHPAAAAAMARCHDELWGNPASQHAWGRNAHRAIEDAREDIARILGAKATGRRPDQVIFTSGGTEANNLAIFGLAAARGAARSEQAIVSSAIEHPSVSEPLEELERRGCRVERLKSDSDGIVQVAQLHQLLHEHTPFVTVMLANHETGVLQPVQEVVSRCAEVGVPVHSDASQAAGKLPIDFQALGVSTMSVAAHKFHGPVGIGALVVRHEVKLPPALFGGFQQQATRPGTEPVALVLGMHAALAAWESAAESRISRLTSLRDRFEAGLAANCPVPVGINGAGAERVPNTSNIAFVGLDRQALLMALDLAGVACSTGSACASGSSEPSPVLIAMGASDAVLASSLRFSFGETTTQEEIDEALARICATCARLAGAPSPQPLTPNF